KDIRDYSLLAHNTFGIDAKCKRFLECSQRISRHLGGCKWQSTEIDQFLWRGRDCDHREPKKRLLESQRRRHYEHLLEHAPRKVRETQEGIPPLFKSIIFRALKEF
ncbi:MAG: hypothetical protein EGQ75_06210, partial [Clostridiales bacterium]|nr:hypothetical protein [Clostridiales bacterium]